MVPTIFSTPRYLRQGLAPAEVSVETSVLTLPERRIVKGLPQPLSIEMTGDEPQREVVSSTFSAPPVATPPSVVTIDLGEELYPLFQYLNAQVAPTRPLVLTTLQTGMLPTLQPGTLPSYRRGTVTRFAPNALEVRLDLLDYFGTTLMPAQPVGFRRQLLLSLLEAGTVHRSSVRGVRASNSERARGSARAPVIFEFNSSGSQVLPAEPYFTFSLIARCEAGDRWQAIRASGRIAH